MAIGLGVKIIEKHVTDDLSEKELIVHPLLIAKILINLSKYVTVYISIEMENLENFHWMKKNISIVKKIFSYQKMLIKIQLLLIQI